MEGNRDTSATYSHTQNPSASSSVVKVTEQSATGEMEPEFAIEQSCYSSDPLKMKITSRWSSKAGEGQQETGLTGSEKMAQKTGKDAASSNSKSPKRHKQNVTSESALAAPSSSSSSSSSSSAAAAAAAVTATATAAAARAIGTDTAVSTAKTMGNIQGSEGTGPGGQILVDPDDPVLQETINKSLVDKGGGVGEGGGRGGAGGGGGDNNNASPEEEGDVSLQELDPGDLAVFFNASNSSETELLNLDNSDLIRDQIVDALVNSQGSTATGTNGGQASVTSAESTTAESTSTAVSQAEHPGVTTGVAPNGDPCNNNNGTLGGDKSQTDTAQPKSTPVTSVSKTSTVTVSTLKHNHSSRGTNGNLATKRTVKNTKDKANPVAPNLKRAPVTPSSKSSDEPAKKKRAMPSQKLQPKLSSPQQQTQLQQKQKVGAKLVRDSPALCHVKAKPNTNSGCVRAPNVKSSFRPGVSVVAMTSSKANTSCARTDSRSPSTKQKSILNSNPRGANSDNYAKPDSTSKLKPGGLFSPVPISRKMKPDSTSKLKTPSHNTEPKTQSHSKPKQVVNAKPKIDSHSKARPDSNAKLRPEGKVNLQTETWLNSEKEKLETQNKAAADSSSEVVPDGGQKVVQLSSRSVEADSPSIAQTDSSNVKPFASAKVKKPHSQVKPKSSTPSKSKADSSEKSSAKKTVNAAIKTKAATNSNSRTLPESHKNKEDLNSDSSWCSKTSNQAPLQSSKKTVSIKARPDSRSSQNKQQSHTASKEKVQPRTTNKVDSKVKDSGSVSSKKKLSEATQRGESVSVKKAKADSQPKARLDSQSKKLPEKDKPKVDTVGESASIVKQTCSTVEQLCAQELSSSTVAMAVAPQPDSLLRIDNESNVSPDSGIHESSFAGSPANHDPPSPSRQAQTSSQEPSDPEGPPVLENMKESEPVPCHDDATLVAPVLTERFEAVKCDNQNKTHNQLVGQTCETVDKDKPQQQEPQPQPAPVVPVKRGPGRPRKNPIKVVAPGPKRSPGRPKGSGQRKSKNIMHKLTSNQKQPDSKSADIPATLRKKPRFKKRKMGTKLVTLPNGIQVLVPVRKGPGRPPKNPLPLDIMKGLKALPPSALTKPIKMSALDGLLGRTKSKTKSSFVSSSGKPYNIGPPVLQLDSPPKKRGPGRPPKQRPTEQDAELQSLLRSIQHSILHQFEQQGESGGVASADASSKSSTLATNSQSSKDGSGPEKPSNTNFVPLIRKPKLHVLTKTQKKKNRKKTGEGPSGAPVAPNNLNVPLGLNPSFGGLLAMSAVSRVFPGTGSSRLTSSLIKQHMEKNNKFTLPPLAPLSPLSGHGSLPSPQTPKSTESKSDDGLSKRRRKKHSRFKTKHKNIVDPRFIAEVEDLSSSISSLYISKPPSLVEEIPPRILLPGIFHLSQEAARLKRRQELHLSKHRKLESKKDLAPNSSGNTGTASDDASQPQSLADISSAVAKDKMKRRRRKKVAIEGETEVLSDSGDAVSSEQCLPLKKRHKALAATQLNEKGEEVGEDGTVVVRTPEKRRPGRPRKHAIVETTTTTTATEVSASPFKADHVTRNSIDEAIEATVQKYTTDLSRATGERPKVAFDTSVSRRKSESKSDSKTSAGSEEEKSQKPHRGPGRPRKVSESEKSAKKTVGESIATTTKDSAVARGKVDSSAGPSAVQDAGAAPCKKSVETATETESESRPKTSHSEMAIQTDSDMQTDLDSTQSQPKPTVKKTVTLDIGVQVDPAEMMAEQEKPTDKVLCSSSVAIQVTEPVPVMQPLEIQVDMDDTDHANVGTSPRRPLQSPRKNSSSSPRGVGRHSPRSPQRASPRLSPRKPVAADTASEDFPIVSPLKGSEATSPSLSSAKPEGAAVEKPRGRSPGRPRTQKSPRKLKPPPSHLNSSGENSEVNLDVPLNVEHSRDGEDQEKPKTVCVALPKKMLTPRFEAEFERFLYDAKAPCRGPRTSSPRGAGPPTDSHYSEMDSSNSSERYGSGDAGTDQHEKLDTSSESEKLNKSSEPEVCVIDDSDRDGDNRDVIVIDEEEDEETGCLACLQLQKDASKTPPKKRGPGRPSKRGRPPKHGRQNVKRPHTCNKESGAKSDSESVVILDKPAKCNKGSEQTSSSQLRVRIEDSTRDPTPSTSRGTSGAVPPPYVNVFSQGDTDSLLDTSNSLLEDSMDITTTTQSGFSSQLSQSSQQSDADPSDVDWTPQLEISPHSKFARSEYEPLPLMSKKRKRYKEDMGYSKPKKRRRKKKKLADSLWDLPSFGMDSIDDEPSFESDLFLDSSVCESSASSSQGSRRGSQPGHLSLPKKRFQKAGLFSTTYKDEDVTRRKSVEHKKSMAYDPAEHEHGLMPPPIHVGKYMREKRVDFQLPFDVYLMQQQGLFTIQKIKSPTYKKIRHNVYFDPNIKPRNYEPHPCNCRRPLELDERGCGEYCLNRLVFTECNPSTCPSGEQCSNRAMQKGERAEGLEKYQTDDRGYGVRCKKDIKAGNFICEYLGEVIGEQEFRRRMTEEYSNDRHHYCLNLDSGLVIDGYRMGNICRFVNHSCEPNCEMQKWNVNGVYRIGLFALDDVDPMAELTYDYNFRAYNLAAQQECRCGSQSCRGVMGGRASRPNGQVKDRSGSPASASKDRRRKSKKNKRLEETPRQIQAPLRPLSHRERCFAQKHAIFLLRNLEKVKQSRNQSKPGTPRDGEPEYVRESYLNKADVFLTQFTALKTARSVRTRGLAQAEGNTEVTRAARLAQVFRIIYTDLTTSKDDEGNLLSNPLMLLPSKKKYPEYYKLIKEPIDLTIIDKNIVTGKYKSIESFENDILKLFSNVEEYCGRKTAMGKIIQRLRKVYRDSKVEVSALFEEIMCGGSSGSVSSECDSVDISETADKSLEMTSLHQQQMLDQPLQQQQPEQGNNRPPAEDEEEEEEVISCICNIFRDEGLMIQCERCNIWQHCDCMEVEGDVEHYLCEQCDPRAVRKEILLAPQPDDALPNCTYYQTLMQGDTQVRVGECVYLVQEGRERSQVSPEDALSMAYRNSELDPDKLDIFRVERLFKNNSGKRFAYGHYYLRPHETYHEPSRKFFPNEVFRVPLYENVPLTAVVGECCVMDLATYCKGRPKGVQEEDVYICEYRVDKKAHLFSKISRPNYPVNCKSYCFDHFEKKLQPKRTYSPHEVPDSYKRRGGGGGRRSLESRSRVQQQQQSSSETTPAACEVSYAQESDEDVPLIQIQQKKERLNGILVKLLSTIPGKNPVDMSWMLDGGKRQCKKPATFYD